MLSRYLLVAAFIGTVEAAPAPQQVAIFWGQSNMCGANINDRHNVAYINGSHVPNVVAWDGAKWVSYKQRVKATGCTGIGPEYGFAVEWSRTHPGQTLGIIKYSVGGSSMERWQPGGDLHLRLMEIYAQAASLPVVGVFIAQGEADSKTVTLSQLYPSRIEGAITAIRNVVGQVPVVFALTQRKSCCVAAIQNEQLYLATWPGIGVAQTGDLKTIDGLHFTIKAQNTLGIRMFEVWGNL